MIMYDYVNVNVCYCLCQFMSVLHCFTVCVLLLLQFKYQTLGHP